MIPFNRCMLIAIVVASTLTAPSRAVFAAEEVPAGASPAGVATTDAARAVETQVRKALKEINPNLSPDYIGPAAVPGYQEVIVKGQVVFVTNDGNFLIQGLTDLRDRRDIAQFGALPGRRLQALSEIPASERIVFAPTEPAKYRVSVFTDVECGFCRKLHQDIAEYNRLGIAIEYIAFPRAGIDSEDAKKMVSVWCSSDRKKALTDAKKGAKIPALSCANPVAKHYEIGQRIGLQGTPMLINEDGIALPGYLPPDKLLGALQKIAAQRAAR